MVAKGDFAYHGDHLICPQGKVLRRGSSQQRTGTYQYVARTRGCQACPIKETRLPPRQNRRYFTLTMYHPLYLRARERNRTVEYRRERRRRQTIVEGAFASMDRLGWARSRLRGLWKVDCEGHMSALAHNVLKMVRRLGHGIGPPGPALPDAPADASTELTAVDAVTYFTALLRRFSRFSWLIAGLRPALR